MLHRYREANADITTQPRHELWQTSSSCWWASLKLPPRIDWQTSCALVELPPLGVERYHNVLGPDGTEIITLRKVSDKDNYRKAEWTLI